MFNVTQLLEKGYKKCYLKERKNVIKDATDKKVLKSLNERKWLCFGFIGKKKKTSCNTQKKKTIQCFSIRE
jgi:hypothetical protein